VRPPLVRSGPAEGHADAHPARRCGFSTERALEDLPLLQDRPGWDDLPAVRDGRVYFSDGNAYFSRPGPRLVDSLEVLAAALHPSSHPAAAAPAVVVGARGAA
jgi:iron complex transport system substrate-binding protein